MSDDSRTWILMTGVSRGLGAALANQLRARGLSVCALVRPASFSSAQRHADHCLSWDCSLPWQQNQSQELLNFVQKNSLAGFIHAAGILGPMETTPEPTDYENWQRWWSDVGQAHQVNHRAGLELIWAIRSSLKTWKMKADSERSPFVMHISSGAALKPYVGWSAYCSSKAAMLMDFKCLAAQHDAKDLLCLSVAPGTVMTDMMRQVLSANAAEFPSLSKFKELEKSGGLVAPEHAANLIATWLIDSSNADLSRWHGEFYDVRTSK